MYGYTGTLRANSQVELEKELVYGPVTRLPNTTEARAKIPADIQFPMLRATLETGSSAAADGASCEGEYNARPCIAPFQAPFDKRIEAMGEQAPSPQNQTCGSSAAAIDGRPRLLATC